MYVAFVLEDNIGWQRTGFAHLKRNLIRPPDV